MIALAALSLLALLASVGLTLSGAGTPAAAAHLAFAVGIVPLIFGAMIHFVGVLTRTGEASLRVLALPFVAQATGGLVVAVLLLGLPRNFLVFAALLELLLCLTLLGWILGRARACVGPAHPGWRWYAVALVFFALGLCLASTAVHFPQNYPQLRLTHLHANLLGFIGLTAFGTLPVLLPTALGRADTGAAQWLRHRLWPMAVGVGLVTFSSVLVMAGPVLFVLVAMAGAILMGACLFSLLWHWHRQFGLRTLTTDAATASLLAAVFGFVSVLGAGMAHGLGWVAAPPSLPAWGCAFLLPLLTGALTQLLPVWRWPGPRTSRYTAMRAKLAMYGRWRALCCLAGGLCFLMGWSGAGAGFALIVLALFIGGWLAASRT